MVEDTNVTAIIGRLTRNAELKKLPALTVGFFTIATNRKKKNPDGSYEPEASFFDVNIFGKYAEIMTPDLKQGVQVSITGELKQERWKDNGVSRSRVVLLANSIQIIDRGGRNAQ
jgi:single-strand DNA-binding protein